MNTSKILTMAFIAIAGLSMSACNTIEGAGQDIENAGEAVQGAVK